MLAKNQSGGQRTVRYISAGDQFGALMLFSDEDIPVDIVVDEKSVLFRLQKDAAAQLMDQFPILRRNLLRKIGFAVHDSMHWRRTRIISKIVTFFHTDDQSRRLVLDIASQLDRIGEQIGIIGDDSVDPPDHPNIEFKSLLNQAGEHLDQGDVRALIERLPDLDRVFCVVDRAYPAEKLRRLVKLSDMAFCLSSTTDVDSVVQQLKGLVGQSPSLGKKTNLVWLLGENQQVVSLQPNLSELIHLDFKVPQSQPAKRQGIQRIIHHLRDVNIGLALSGGAAHGMAHLGVLRALEEAGITVDRIAGTSAGTLTGVLYCAGYTPDWGIKAFTHDLEPGAIYNWFPKGDGLYMLEKYRSHSWDRMLRKYLHDWRLEQLPIPVTTVTTDLVRAEAVARTTGDAVHSILESINLPVLSPPICRDGRLLVDGGIVNNLPADLLVKQGSNFVIGVDVAAHVEQHVGDNFPETPTDQMKAPGIVSTMLRCLRVQAHNMSAVGADPADVIIAPDVSDFEPTAFAQTPEMAETGYRATNESLPRIKELLQELDGKLFA
jgi:predicted acylesterase/phospholipase RssA